MTREQANAAIREGAWAFSVLIGLASIPFTVFVVGERVLTLQPYKPLMASVAFVGLHTMVSGLPEVFDLASVSSFNERKRVEAFYLFLLCLVMAAFGMVAFIVLSRVALRPDPLAGWIAGTNVVFVAVCVGIMFYVRRTLERSQ